MRNENVRKIDIEFESGNDISMSNCNCNECPSHENNRQDGCNKIKIAINNNDNKGKEVLLENSLKGTIQAPMLISDNRIVFEDEDLPKPFEIVNSKIVSGYIYLIIEPIMENVYLDKFLLNSYVGPIYLSYFPYGNEVLSEKRKTILSENALVKEVNCSKLSGYSDNNFSYEVILKL